jgi:hypothetical protein
MKAIIQLSSYLLFLISIPLISALKFDVPAHRGHESAKHERCIRNFVAKDQLVVVTANVDGYRGDGQQLNLHVCTFLNSLNFMPLMRCCRSKTLLDTTTAGQRM